MREKRFTMPKRTRHFMRKQTLMQEMEGTTPGECLILRAGK